MSNIRLTAATIANVSYYVAWAILAVVLAAAVLAVVLTTVSYTPTEQPTYTVKPDTLFTASATLMGLAAFGTALSTLGHNNALIKGIAYTLVPLIGVQAVFMVSILERIGIPVSLWMVMTGILLMLLVLVMVANRIEIDKVDGSMHK